MPDEVSRQIARLKFHGDVPSTPYYSAKVSDFCTVADDVDVFALFRNGCGSVSDGHNDGICRNFKLFAVFALNFDAVVGDCDEFGFKMHGHFVECKILSQIRGVGKADALDCDEDVLHLNDGGMFASELQFVCDFATGQATADDNDVVANFFVAEQEVASLDRLFDSGDFEASCHRTGCNDDFVCAEFADVVNFDAVLHFDAQIFDLFFVPLDKFLVLFLEGRRGCRDENAAEEMITAITAVYDACLAHDFLDSERLKKVLSELSDSDVVNPLISGFACALLAEKGEISNEKMSELVSRRLSRGTPPAEAAAWFEGLARRNRRSLIIRLTLWEKLCTFIDGLDDEEFKPVLIALRRTFAEFTPAEKNDIAENIGEVLGISAEQAAEIITAEVTAEEQQTIDELDDFDFGDI